MTGRWPWRRAAFAELYEQRRPLYHATADALVDAEQLEGGEPLLVPLAGRRRWPSCRGWWARGGPR